MSCYHYFLICNYYANVISFLHAHSAEIEECCHLVICESLSIILKSSLAKYGGREHKVSLYVDDLLLYMSDLVTMSKELRFNRILSSGSCLWRDFFCPVD